MVGFELSGQSDEYPLIKISGIVFESDSLGPLPNSHFQILGKNKAGLTNLSGRFEVFVVTGDTLKFTYVGYKDTYFVVNDSLRSGDYVIGVFMSRDTFLIREVVVYPRRKNLRQDFMSIKPDEDLQLINAKRNIRISSYQGLNGKQIPWDSDASYKMFTQQKKMEASNLGMVAPNQMVGLNLLMLIPYAIYRLNHPDEKKQPEDIYISESEYKSLLKEYMNQFREKPFVSNDSSISK